jgi:tellurite resistance protein TerC
VKLPVWFEAATFAVLGVLLLVDLAIVAKRPHVPSMREATAWVTFYVTLALAFGVLLLLAGDAEAAGAFIAGWITEYSLSVDNLFVFVLIMSRFAVPREYQQKVLMIGIILSLVLRGGFILLGTAVIERFSWAFYIFGAFLIYTAIHLALDGSNADDELEEENAIVRRARAVLPISPTYVGGKLVTHVDGRRLFTPMVLVLLAIGTTDLLFALDSIPAIFGLTQDPFIVYTATIFALMGLRQLYFLLGGLLDRLVYLSFGLSLILGFIGVKLVLEALHVNELPFINGGEHVEWAPEIPIWFSLTFIIVTLLITAVASLLKSRSDATNGGQGPGGAAGGARPRARDEQPARSEGRPPATGEGGGAP